MTASWGYVYSLPGPRLEVPLPSSHCVCSVFPGNMGHTGRRAEMGIRDMDLPLAQGQPVLPGPQSPDP